MWTMALVLRRCLHASPSILSSCGRVKPITGGLGRPVPQAQRLPESLRTALRLNDQAGAGAGRPRAGRARSATGPPLPLMSRGNSGAGLPEGQHASALAEKVQLRRASTSKEPGRRGTVMSPWGPNRSALRAP